MKKLLLILLLLSSITSSTFAMRRAFICAAPILAATAHAAYKASHPLPVTAQTALATCLELADKLEAQPAIRLKTGPFSWQAAEDGEPSALYTLQAVPVCDKNIIALFNAINDAFTMRKDPVRFRWSLRDALKNHLCRIVDCDDSLLRQSFGSNCSTEELKEHFNAIMSDLQENWRLGNKDGYVILSKPAYSYETRTEQFFSAEDETVLRALFNVLWPDVYDRKRPLASFVHGYDYLLNKPKQPLFEIQVPEAEFNDFMTKTGFTCVPTRAAL